MDPSLAPVNSAGVILIADDNPEARRMLELRVKKEGHRVLLVENGVEALDVLATQPVDIVLLDLYMPEKDGFEVLSTLKADPRYRNLPVLIISGGGDQEDLVRCIEMGAVDYLPKPFNQALLRARLRACLASKRQRERENPSPSFGLIAFSAAPTLDARAQEAARPLPAVSPPLPTPTPGNFERIGRIRLDRPIGSGGMSHVFLGHHELLDLPVAVKVLRPEMLKDPEMAARTLREARVAARIGHRNVVRLHEVGETADSLYLAYEYVEGGTLEELLNRTPHRQLDIPSVLRLTREIVTGLAEINWLGITHRDLKPSNILLTPTGEAKIADLGLAKYCNTATAPALTAEFFVVGTPLYMAPEQAEGTAGLDIRCDLYSLGVILFEMLTGTTPFTGVVPMAVLAAHMFQPVRPPSLLRPDVPPWLETLCLKLLAKDRGERVQMPENVLTELQAHGG